MINPIGILDTSVIIDLPSLQVNRLPTEGTISAITLAELSIGPITAKDATTRVQRQLRIQAAEAQFSVLPFDTRSARMYAIVYGTVGQFNGSGSAEHGIGVQKLNYLHYSRSPAELAIMQTLKQALDPQQLLNSGRVLLNDLRAI